jgi:hypothetical protein
MELFVENVEPNELSKKSSRLLLSAWGIKT